MNSVYITIASYLGVLVLLLVLINLLTNGFLFKYLRVKASRGQKILVDVKSKLQHYYEVGRVEGGFLIFRDKEARADSRKTSKHLQVSGNPFYRQLNVNCVNVDEEKNCIINVEEFKNVPGFDAIKWSNLLLRAQMKIKLHEQPIFTIIILIATILSFLGIIYLAVQINALSEAVSLIQPQNIITGGNVG